MNTAKREDQSLFWSTVGVSLIPAVIVLAGVSACLAIAGGVAEARGALKPVVYTAGTRVQKAFSNTMTCFEIIGLGLIWNPPLAVAQVVNGICGVKDDNANG